MSSNTDHVEPSDRLKAAARALYQDHLGPALPWYDSIWLQAFIKVCNHLRDRHPDQLDQLEAMVKPLRTDPAFRARHLPGFVEPDTLLVLRDEVAAIVEQPVSTYERERFGRDLLHNRPLFTELAQSLAGRVSELVGEPVEPYYNFLSLYGAEGICDPHLDAPEAKWTLDICIAQSDRWPIHISPVVRWPTDWDHTNNDAWQEHIKSSHDFAELTMEPSDAVIFSGSSQWHYRNPFPGTGPHGFCHLLFLHYIPAGTAEIIKPTTWARELSLPSLTAVTARYRSHYRAD